MDGRDCGGFFKLTAKTKEYSWRVWVAEIEEHFKGQQRLKGIFYEQQRLEDILEGQRRLEGILN